MHSFAKNLPEHWQEWIENYSLKKSGGKYDSLSAGDFRGRVRLSFEDGSYCFFEDAFYVEDEQRDELLVLTEHCGYYVFTLSFVTYEYFEWTEPKVKLEDGE